MRRNALLLISLIVAVSLAACRDGMPTDASLRPPTAPRRVLVSGPVTPIDAGAVTSTIVTIASLPNDNLDANTLARPRVSGDLACYADHASSVVRSYRFSTNTGAPIENPAVRDIDCAVDGNHIAFISVGDLLPPFVGVFDASTSRITKIDPLLPANPRFAAIGGSTVSFIEVWDAIGHNKVRVANLTSPDVSTVLSDVDVFEDYPNVSPDGNVLVWERISLDRSTSSVMKAIRDPSTGTWGAPQVMATYTGGHIPGPDTDGSYIVWRAPTLVGTEIDILVQAVSGGPIMQVAIPGTDAEPRIDAGVVAFWHASRSTVELMSYVIATNTLYRVANGSTFPVNYRNLDVSVLADGNARVVWDDFDATNTNDIVQGRTFSVATTPPPPVFSFGGFQQPLGGGTGTANAHAVINVKFSLGGNFGLNIFAPGSPTSANANCTSGALLGAASPTAAQGPLTYNSTTDTYTYKWNSDIVWAGTCRKLTLTFVDGTTASALVTFR